MFNAPGMHVLDVELDDQGRLVLSIGSDRLGIAAHRVACWRSATVAGWMLHDAPCLGRVTARTISTARRSLFLSGAGPDQGRQGGPGCVVGTILCSRKA